MHLLPRVGRAAFGLLLLTLAACHFGDRNEPHLVGSSRPLPKPVDRLAPNELEPGTVKAFGLIVPKSMRLERLYPDAAHIVGSVSPDAVANYVRQRVNASQVEIGAARTIFPAVHIKGGPPDRTFRIEIVAERGKTRLVIRDITPPQTVQGLSQAERWRQAGLTPDGKLLDPKHMQ
jgi:hypothetical protein